jgi:hypothetical protein
MEVDADTLLGIPPNFNVLSITSGYTGKSTSAVSASDFSSNTKSANLWWMSDSYYSSIKTSELFNTNELKASWAELTRALTFTNSTILTINSSGKISTAGAIVSGLGTNNPIILNTQADTWKIKYGSNYKSWDFFGVAIPSSASDWGRGIRFNYGTKSVIINDLGIRWYTRAHSGADWSPVVTLTTSKIEKLLKLIDK